jgi:hypothetical protein
MRPGVHGASVAVVQHSGLQLPQVRLNSTNISNHPMNGSGLTCTERSTGWSVVVEDMNG